MIGDMIRLEQVIRRRGFAQRCQPTQSLTPLRLFTGTTASEMSLESSLTASSKRTMRPVGASGSPGTLIVLPETGNGPPNGLTPRQCLVIQLTSTLLGLSPNGLPLIKHICLQSPELRLNLSDLHLSFEFVGVAIGRHRFEAIDRSAPGESAELISALDIPTEDEIALACSENRSGLSFGLRHNELVIEVEITWGAYSE